MGCPVRYRRIGLGEVVYRSGRLFWCVHRTFVSHSDFLEPIVL